MNSPLRALLRGAASSSDGAEGFDALADHLLRGDACLVAGGALHRLVEIEVYVSSARHPDPFVHRAPLQQREAGWYVHRAGGSFKGIDLAFGDTDTFAGVLIRSLRLEGGAVINGPSRCMDRLLACTGQPSPGALHAVLAPFSADDPRSPLHLRSMGLSAPLDLPLWKTARVGLTLRRAAQRPGCLAYIGRPYRYLTDGRAVKKGRLQHILALHVAGTSPEKIRDITGSPLSAIVGAIGDHEAGAAAGADEETLCRWGSTGRRRDLGRLYGGVIPLSDALAPRSRSGGP